MTDLFLDQLVTDYSLYSTYQTYKGVVFFSIASTIFFLIIRHLLSKLKDKEESLLYALEAANMATWDYDIQTHEITRSKNHHNIYGYKKRPDEWSFSQFLHHVPENEKEKVKRELIESIETNGTVNTELAIETADGQRFWRWIRGKVQYDADNNPARISGVLIDIDGRKKAEQKLQREEKFIEASINSVPGIFFVLNKDGYILRWNDNSNQISGLTDEELKNMHATQRVVQNDIPKTEHLLNEVLTKGEIQDELCLKTTGEENPVYKITASRFESNGEYFIVGTGIDITAEKKLEKEIQQLLRKERKARRQTEGDIKKLKSTFDKAPSAMCILEGPNHVYTYANNAYKGVVGEEDLLGKPIGTVIPEIKEQGFIDILDDVYRKGESYSAKEKTVTIQQKENSEVNEYIFNLIYEPLYNEDGDVYGIFAEGVDVSEQVNSRKKIKRQNYQLKTAQEIANLGYWERNLVTDELVWTDIVYDLFGLDKDKFNLTIENFLNLVHPNDLGGVEDAIQALKQTGTFKTEYRIIRPNGSIGWFREKGEVFEWEDGDPKTLHGIVLDITQQKKAEKEIRKSLLEGENKERKRIANELHDGIAQYLSAALLHFDGAIEPLLNIEKRSEHTQKLMHVRSLVKDALAETQTISHNLMPKTIEKYGMGGAIRSLIEQYEVSTDIQFHFTQQEEIESKLNNEIEINVYRMIQELLSNAVRHANCDTVWITLRKEKQLLICVVRDNGTGKDLPESFETDGLGLRTIYNRAQLLSGSVQFNNNPGKGIEVRIEVPIL